MDLHRGWAALEVLGGIELVLDSGVVPPALLRASASFDYEHLLQAVLDGYGPVGPTPQEKPWLKASRVSRTAHVVVGVASPAAAWSFIYAEYSGADPVGRRAAFFLEAGRGFFQAYSEEKLTALLWDIYERPRIISVECAAWAACPRRFQLSHRVTCVECEPAAVM